MHEAFLPNMFDAHPSPPQRPGVDAVLFNGPSMGGERNGDGETERNGVALHDAVETHNLDSSQASDNGVAEDMFEALTNEAFVREDSHIKDVSAAPADEKAPSVNT